MPPKKKTESVKAKLPKDPFEKVLDDCRKIVGDEGVVDLSKTIEQRECVTTGHPFIDWVCGAEVPSDDYPTGRPGGVYYGKHHEISGMESSGKSKLAYCMAAQVQRRKNRTGRVAIMDYEHSFEKYYFELHGGLTDQDHLVVFEPQSGEDGIEISKKLITGGFVDLIINDSVAAMSPKASLAEGAGQPIGEHARLLSTALRSLNSIMATPEVAIIWINQVRNKFTQVGGMMQASRTTTGGNALKFYCHVRLEVNRKEEITREVQSPFSADKVKEVVGIRSQIRSLKNKMGIPARRALVTFNLRGSYDLDHDLIEAALGQQILKQAGAGWLDLSDVGFPGKKLQGMPALKAFLRTEEGYRLRQQLVDVIFNNLKKLDRQEPDEDFQIDMETGEVVTPKS